MRFDYEDHSPPQDRAKESHLWQLLLGANGQQQQGHTSRSGRPFMRLVPRELAGDGLAERRWRSSLSVRHEGDCRFQVYQLTRIGWRVIDPVAGTRSESFSWRCELRHELGGCGEPEQGTE